MWKKLLLVLSVLVLAAGCGDDDEDQAADAEAFCAEFQQQPAIGASLGNQAAIEEALAFFQALEENAPAEIEEPLETLTDGLESIVEAFAGFDGADGPEALDAVEEASGVSLDELSDAASEVDDFASENCEDLEPAS